MVMSLDGRIVVDGWPSAAEQRREYEQVDASYEADGWICGRVTMEPFAGAVRSDAEVARVYRGDAAREDFIAPGARESFAFAIDASSCSRRLRNGRQTYCGCDIVRPLT